MKDKQTKYPQLRFKGFTDPWEERKWIDTVDMSTNMVDPKTGKYDKLLHIGPGNIESFTGRILDNVNTVKDDNLISGKFHFNPNDIIYGKINPQLAKYTHVNFEGLASADTYVLNSKNEITQDFLYVELQTSEFYKYSVSVSMRTGMPKINRDELNQFRYLAPKNIEEQQKIGVFFKQLDSTITLHQRKLAKLKKLKQGYLQKLFPRNGSKFPQLRFAGFADAWEERKLGDVVGEIQSGNRLPKDSLTNGDVPYVVAQTKNDGVFKKIARGTLDYNGNPMKLFPGNSISFSIDNPEAMFYRNAEFYTSNIMRVIHEDHLTHEQYVFIIENMKRFIRGYDWSRKFSGPVVSNLEYLQPSEEEQQKIGSFFKQLDDTITLHQRKLEKLQELKKGYLQKMFC
ncbi:restriction endonuclease subunit S [Lactiplantibacillus plantarum]|nr:restriction endonuclease subunit S [Lactiplantibacillus plantarum]MCK6240930.1 restriction endonuclease subunit S [Lactiplantibacillus plantarum]